MEKITPILNAARDLFAEKGFDQTPIAEIAKKAGVAGGTIIYHFKSKENLLFILTRQIFYSLYRQAQIETSSAPSGMDAVERYIGAFFSFLDTREDDFKVLLKTNPFDVINHKKHPSADIKLIFDRYLDLLTEAIKRGQVDGSIRAGDPSNLAKAISAALFGSAQLKLAFGDNCASFKDSTLHFARFGLQK